MMHVTDVNAQMKVSLGRGGEFLLIASLSHLATLQLPRLGRRELRALGMQVMAEVAMAWAEPACRERWRAAGK